MRGLTIYSVCSLTLLCGAPASLFGGTVFYQTNLVSNISGMAAVTDSNLKDPWGMSFSATSPIWVSDRGAGVSTLYNGLTGAAVPLVVTVPPGSPLGPTGQVFSGGGGFSGNPSFIFDTLGGTIDTWGGGTTATVVDTTPGASYEGLASANSTLYAANFGSSGGINVFSSSYAPESLAGIFSDPNIPAGYSPFNIQNINGQLYVEYAKVTTGVPVPLPGGGGFVDVFNTDGTFAQRLVSNGPLDAPWGVAVAPAGFGSFGGDLLVGNFGNGEINAFDLTTGVFMGTLTDQDGDPIVNNGLWALDFGNSSANPNALYFTAGIDQGADGLFGDIQVAPEPTSFGLVLIGGLALLGYVRRRSRLPA